MSRDSRSPSIIFLGDSDGSDYAPESSGSVPAAFTSAATGKRKRVVAPASKSKAKTATKRVQQIESHEASIADIEDTGSTLRRPHGTEYHRVEQIVQVQSALLDWFEDVRERRGMPWRKRYDPSATMEEKGQRAYEIWVSEVMLQQTQVSTVIAYWQRWIDRWPTIADLAKADIEEVNAAWRGLGYYRRARSLLAGAKTVMGSAKYKGRLPNDPAVLEKEIDGVGRYTAGAICSMAYGVRTPIVDGNIHRLLTRLLAVHAPQAAPTTIKFLWTAAEQLVDDLPRGEGRKGVAGDWNQALMEHGSQICKPVSPECSTCPLRTGCKAYAELSGTPPTASSDICTLCAPIPSSTDSGTIPSVMVFPMRKEKKVSRDEEEAVCIVEWHGAGGERRWLFVKRPEKGLLAGLFEPPTTQIRPEIVPKEQLEVALTTLATLLNSTRSDLSSIVISHRDVGNIPHIFSHINMTYHIQHLVLVTSSSSPPELKANPDRTVVWLDAATVEAANVGTGVKKVWAEVYGSWGLFDSAGKSSDRKVTKKQKTSGGSSVRGKKVTQPLAESENRGENGRILKKVMMPAMPVRKTVKEVLTRQEETILVE